MINRILPHVSYHFDFLPFSASAPKDVLPDGSAIFPVVLSYTGTRKYFVDGQEVIVLRRPEQVGAPSHRRTLRLNTATSGHPKIERDGVVYPVWLDVYGQGELDELGCVHLPDTEFRVGQTGDIVEFKNIKGYSMPTGYVSIKVPECARSILNGRTQTSLGYFSLRLPPPPEEMVDGFGIWNGPNGPEKYQLEQVMDLEDPRLQIDYLVGEGIAQDKADAEHIRSRIGANHLAVNIPEGRGGPDVQIQLDEGSPKVVDMGKSFFGTNKCLAVCFDASIPDFPVDNGKKVENTAHETLRNVNLKKLMKLNLNTILPRLSHFLDEEGVAPLPKTQVDMPEEVLEIIQMIEARVMEAFAAVKEQLGMAETAAKSAEEKAVQQELAAQNMQKVNMDLKAECDKLRAERDQAFEELTPIRRERTEKEIVEALKVGGLDVATASSFDSVEDAKKAAVFARAPHLKNQNWSKDFIEGHFQALCDSAVKAAEKAKDSTFFAAHRDENILAPLPNLIDAGKYELEQIRKSCN